jgi:hypothetical protein
LFRTGIPLFDLLVLESVEEVGHQEEDDTLAVEEVGGGRGVHDLGDRVVKRFVEGDPVVTGQQELQ